MVLFSANTNIKGKLSGLRLTIPMLKVFVYLSPLHTNNNSIRALELKRSFCNSLCGFLCDFPRQRTTKKGNPQRLADSLTFYLIPYGTYRKDATNILQIIKIQAL